MLLQLIRWKNLLIILATQLLLWLCVIRPAVAPNYLLHPLNFLCLCSSTLLIAAAGYIINDYFDIRIDAINRPEKVILEKFLHRRNAILWHSGLNLLGLILAAFVARQVGHYEWLLLQLLCTLLLWLYSTHFKRQFVTGNVIVSLMTALSLIVLWLYEPSLNNYGISVKYTNNRPNPVFIIIAYSFFAFMLTWMREVVKDMEDHIGDEAEGCVTMPIVWGLKRTARFVQLLSAITLVVLSVGIVYLYGAGDWYLALYATLAIILPLCWWSITLTFRYTVSHYHRYSAYLKWIMVAGVAALPVSYLAHYA